MVTAGHHRTVLNALGALLPAADETLLLRACLLHDERGAAAWETFKTDHRELTELFRTDHGELRRLGPLLSQGLKESGADADARLWTVLRTSRLREGLRGKICQDVLRDSLNALREADVPNIVFRGAANGELLYPDIALRHSHDIDLLVRPELHERAIAALLRVGFSRDAVRTVEGGRQRVVSLTHGNSLPIRLHSSLLELKGYDASLDELWHRSSEVQLAGTKAHVLCPADNLLQTVAHAAYSGTRHTLQWAADAYLIIRAAPDVDWTRFVAQCLSSRVALPVSVLMEFLARELGAPIPSDALGIIAAAAAGSNELERDWALYGARAGAKTGLRALFDATPKLGERARLAHWLLRPSHQYLAWAERTAATKRGGGLTGRLFRFAKQRLSE